MSINRPLRQHKAREARRIIKEQLAGVEEETIELVRSRLSKAELKELEVEEYRHSTIINGNDPDDHNLRRYITLGEYNQALDTLQWHVTDAEQAIVGAVRQRIRRDQEWNALWVSDYYADLREDEARFTASI